MCKRKLSVSRCHTAVHTSSWPGSSCVKTLAAASLEVETGAARPDNSKTLIAKHVTVVTTVTHTFCNIKYSQHQACSANEMC